MHKDVQQTPCRCSARRNLHRPIIEKETISDYGLTWFGFAQVRGTQCLAVH